MLSREEFEALEPKQRGYVVYMAGCREDEPNIPDEKNPYPAGSNESKDWDFGQRIAVIEAQDCP